MRSVPGPKRTVVSVVVVVINIITALYYKTLGVGLLCMLVNVLTGSACTAGDSMVKFISLVNICRQSNENSSHTIGLCNKLWGGSIQENISFSIHRDDLH